MKRTSTKLFTSFTKILLILLLCCGMVNVSRAQVSVTATAGTTGPSLYTTVNDAFAAINLGTHQGVIVISVTANTSEPATAVQLLRSGATTSNYQSIKIVPLGNVTINSATTPTAAKGVLEFIGADSITIDGDDPTTTGVRNLTIQVATTTNASTACLRFSSSSAVADGCSKITIKNCNIVGGRSTSTITTAGYGIYSGLSLATSTITTASGAANNDSMTIENNSIQRCYYGIYSYGIAAYLQRSLVIRNNVIGSNVLANCIGIKGIYIANTQTTASSFSALIEGNDIRMGDTISGLSTTLAAIDLNVSNAGTIIRNNNIHDVANPSTGGWGSYGIFISSATNNSFISIYNNMIRDVYAYHYTSSASSYTNYGIYSAIAATNLKIYHNTISLVRPNASSGNSNYSACVYLSSTGTTLAEFSNNIFVNKQSDNTGQACLAIYLGGATIFSAGVRVNNNNYFVNGVSGYVGSITGTNYLTLSNWKTATTKDSLSLNFDPYFISSTNLHLVPGISSPFESSGILTNVVTDIDGDLRPGPFGSVNGGGTAPDIGADEADMGLPSIAIMATGTKANITTNAADLSGSIVNNGGSPITATGIVLSTTTTPVRGSFGVIDSATNPLIDFGSFTKSFSGLSLGTTYFYRSYAVNAIGTAYGPDSTFTTNSAATIPTVLKTAATNIVAYSARVGGNITTDGGSTVTASGVVYAITPNPVLFGTGVTDSTTSPVVSVGTFFVNPAGLTHSTKYYYRAYATNGIGTAYSVQDSFTTAPVINYLPYSQNFDTLSVNTGFTTTAVVGTLNDWQVGTPAKTTLSAAYSTPTAWITKLATNYSTSHDAALVSPQFDFSTLLANPILTFKHKFYTESCCDGGFLEISINGGSWTKVENSVGTGTNFNTSNGTAWYNSTTQGNTWCNVSSAYSTAVNGWITSIIALPGAAGQSNVRFRFRFITDSSLEYEGWEIDNVEVTVPTTPTVVTGTKSNITTSNADLIGTITNNGSSTITASGIVFSTSTTPTRGSFGVIDSSTNPLVSFGNFTISTNGLNAATTYYYRAYAVNAMGTSYGADSSFTTSSSAVIPTVLKISASNITALTATFGGNITSDGGSTVTASGVIYSTTTNPFLYGTGVVDSTTSPLVTLGLYSINPTGLTHATKYYFKAYATNGIGTAYSTMDSFNTAPVISVLPYFQNFDSIGTTGWSSLATSGLNEWVLGTPAKTQLSGSYSSPKCWFTSTAANYSDNHDAAVVSPQFDFTSYAADPIVKFRHNFKTETGWDASVLEISINGGTWTKLDNTLGTGTNFNTTNSISWYNSSSTAGPVAPSKWSQNSNLFSSNVSNWIQSQTPLTGAAGQSNVKFRIRFASDGSGTDEGVAFDNVEVVYPTAPIVLTGTKSNITTSSADLSGTITSNGNSAITKSGVVYSTTSAPVLGAFGVVDSTTNPLVILGVFTKSTAGLSISTLYHYRAYAINAIGTTYGADSTFTTNSSSVIPTVLKIAATNLTSTTATVGGNITSDGGSTVTASGIVYNTTTSPLTLFSTAIDSATSPVVTAGIYSINPAGLTHSTKYYYKAYATNGIGTAYSTIDSFTTDPIVSILPYSQNFEAGAGGWNSMLSSSSTSVNWIVGFPTNNNWVLGTPAKTYLSGAHSGTKAWATKLTGTYDTDHDASIVSPQFDFTSYTADPIVRFSHKFKAETDWDGLIVEISINGGFWNRLDSVVGNGSNFNTTNSYSWYNDNVNFVSSGGAIAPPYFSSDLGSGTVFASQVSGWIESAFRLTGAASQANVRVRFRFIADSYVVDEGWAIDDIEVVNIVTPTTTASSVTISAVTNTTATVSCTIGNGQRRLIVARLTSAAAVAPTNNKLYNANAIYSIGDTTGTGNFVVYNGTGNTVAVTGLTMLTNYTFDAYEYNGKYMHNAFTSVASNNTTTLPVKLSYFEAKKVNDNVKLVWITSSEINNKGFDVQRSVNGKTFETIAFVKGEGNSNNNVMYSSIDENPFAIKQVQKLYYRLNQIDFDGKSTLSPVKEVSINDAIGNDISIYPNPFTSELNIETVNTENTISTVQIIDISGRVLISQTEAVTIGLGTIKLSNTSNLAAGIYLVKISTNGVVKTMKIVKQ